MSACGMVMWAAGTPICLPPAPLATNGKPAFCSNCQKKKRRVRSPGAPKQAFDACAFPSVLMCLQDNSLDERTV